MKLRRINKKERFETIQIMMNESSIKATEKMVEIFTNLAFLREGDRLQLTLSEELVAGACIQCIMRVTGRRFTMEVTDAGVYVWKGHARWSMSDKFEMTVQK